MKKISLVAFMLLLTTSLMAQVKLCDLSLANAIKKAKTDDKLVIVMVSTTWCGPCKFVKNTLFHEEELGNYMNPKFLTLAYNVDVSDPDNVADGYNVKAYPTFVFLNGEGEEIGRMVGGASDAKGFIEKLKNALDSEQSPAYQKAKYEENPIANAAKYIEYLSSIYKIDEALEVQSKVFEQQTIEEKFSESNMEFYTKHIKEFDQPVMIYMMENIKKVDAVLGKGETLKFIHSKIDAKFAPYIGIMTGEEIDDMLKLGDDNKILRTELYKFVKANKEHVLARDIEPMIKYIKKHYKKYDEKLGHYLYLYILKSSFNEKEGFKIEEDKREMFIDFINYLLSISEDDKNKEFLNGMIDTANR